MPFDGSCLKRDRTAFTHGRTVNICIVFEMNFWNYVESSGPAIGNSLGLILINASILDMVLDLIWKEHFLLVDLVKT